VYWDGLSDDLLESIQTDVAPNVGVVALWFLGYALVTFGNSFTFGKPENGLGTLSFTPMCCMLGQEN
jgi:hypothetical protein